MYQMLVGWSKVWKWTARVREETAGKPKGVEKSQRRPPKRGGISVRGRLIVCGVNGIKIWKKSHGT